MRAFFGFILMIILAVAGGCRETGAAADRATAAGQLASVDGSEVCSREPPGDGDTLRIAVIPKGTTHEFWKSIHAGARKAELELRGVQVIWKGPVREDDRTEQINVVENFINTGVDGIALAPLDDTALVRPVREATRAGISVVIADSGLDAEPCSDYASFVATDNYKGGQKGARRLGEVMGGQGRAAMMRYQVGSASTMEREQGFLDVMASEFPGIQIVSADQYGGATTESAYARAENLLNRFTELDGVFTPNESTTFGMLLALHESGRAGTIKFVGFDSSEKLIEAMADGHLHGLVLQDPLNMGYLSVKTLVAYLRGEPVPTRIDTGSEVATPENMNEPRIRELLSPPIERYLSR
jgi:ribose transport system substrate-binding protein